MTVATDRDVAVDTELAACEAVIERGLKTFVEVGEALTTIRVNGLYYQDHQSFESYCEHRWGFTDRHARRLMDAASTVKAIQQAGPIGPEMGTVPKVGPMGRPLPTTEGQARALTGLKPEVAAEVMVKAHEDTAGKVTAAAITQAREQVAPKPPAPKADPPPAPKPRQKPRVLAGDALAKYDAEKSCEHFGAALGSLEGLMVPEHRGRVIEFWKTGELGATPHNRELHTPATIRRLAAALNTYADELEQANV